jgi:hypothetical protein
LLSSTQSGFTVIIVIVWLVADVIILYRVIEAVNAIAFAPNVSTIGVQHLPVFLTCANAFSAADAIETPLCFSFFNLH